MAVTLVFVDKTFKDPNREENIVEALATLEIDEEGKSAVLVFSPLATMVDRLIAKRQAHAICRSGFLLANGKRIGMKCSLEIREDKT